MAAGLGFKDFTTGEVLTAADVDGYLMQGVWVFASAAARDAAVTSPQEGNFAYLKDTNVTTYYTGSAWANLDTTGMTNPMTTTGDTIYSSSGSTPARLGIGTANQQLRVNAGATAPEWFTPTAGGSGLTLISTTTFSGVSSQSFDNVFTSTYTNYKILITITAPSNNNAILMRLRASSSDTTANYRNQNIYSSTTSVASRLNDSGTDDWYLGCDFFDNATVDLTVFRPQVSSKTAFLSLGFAPYSTNPFLMYTGGEQTDSTQFDGFTILNATGIAGTISIYGYAK
jgi:hypothetical protein